MWEMGWTNRRNAEGLEGAMLSFNSSSSENEVVLSRERNWQKKISFTFFLGFYARAILDIILTDNYSLLRFFKSLRHLKEITDKIFWFSHALFLFLKFHFSLYFQKQGNNRIIKLVNPPHKKKLLLWSFWCKTLWNSKNNIELSLWPGGSEKRSFEESQKPVDEIYK
jgi:hypothetical protein